MSEHGEVLSPLQESVDRSNSSNLENGSDSSHGAPLSNKIQNPDIDSHTPFSENSNPLHNSTNAYNALPTFSGGEASADHYGAEQPRSANDDELDPSAAFPGLNQLTGLVPTVSQLTNMVPTNATDALVTVMVTSARDPKIYQGSFKFFKILLIALDARSKGTTTSPRSSHSSGVCSRR